MSAALITALAFSSCDKNNTEPTESWLSDLAGQEAMVKVNTSDYVQEITVALESPNEMSAYTAGVIEYSEDGTVTAVIDYSEGGFGHAGCSDQDGERDFRVERDEDGMRGDEDKKRDCFKFTFPLTVTLTDGSTATVNDYSEMDALHEDCKLNGNCFEFSYPLTLEMHNGDAVTINNEDDLKGAFEKCKPHRKDFKKVITDPLVKVDGCDYIVAGVIKFFKKDKWVATIDFGDGTCDEWATKTTEDGVETFSLDDLHK